MEATTKFVISAEDDDFQQNIVKMLLTGLKVQFSTAKNGNEAVKQYTDKKGAVSLVIMDLQMPELDGYDAAKQIRAWEKANGKPAVKIIAVSADFDAAIQQRIKDAGMNGLVQKPLNKGKIEKEL